MAVRRGFLGVRWNLEKIVSWLVLPISYYVFTRKHIMPGRHWKRHPEAVVCYWYMKGS